MSFFTFTVSVTLALPERRGLNNVFNMDSNTSLLQFIFAVPLTNTVLCKAD